MVAILASPSWRWRRGRQGRLVEKRGLQNEHHSRAGAVTRVTRPERPQNTPWRMSLATRRSTAALSLSGCSASSLCCGPQRRNSFEHFGDEKLRLKLRHVLGYDVSISAQTKRCPEVARCLLLDHDLAQHSLLQGIAPVPRFSKLVGARGNHCRR